MEGTELVEHIQRRALDVLGEPIAADDAGHKRGLFHALLFDEQFQRPEPPPARRDRVHASLGAALVQHGSHGNGAEQRASRDVLGQLLDRHISLDVPHVRLAEQQLVERISARGAEGDFRLLGHRDISATGQPGASLPTSNPVTENSAPLPLLVAPG